MGVGVVYLAVWSYRNLTFIQRSSICAGYP